MLWTIFHHPDLAVSLDDVGLDLTHFLMKELRPIRLAARDGFTSFPHALGAERIGLPRPSQYGLGFLPGLQKRLFCPFRRECRVGIEAVEVFDRIEGQPSPIADCGVDILHDALVEFRFHMGSGGVVGLRSIDQSFFRTRQATSLR